MDRCTIAELCDKEVINICDGKRLGFVSDVEVDVCSGCVHAIVIPGECGLFGLGHKGKKDDLTIPWDKIEKIGDDIILVNAVLSECVRFTQCQGQNNRGTSTWRSK